ncbi:hypothetical protein ACFCYF_38715 [Streptomyces chartreusis]|uniref:hypothetical protein n=1 Tax=Streptomyces chartreusis TaxID=1969 RepID=UPI0035DF51B6
MSTPNRFQMTLDDRSRTIVVDGDDVSDVVASVDVHAEQHGPPLVTLRLAPATAHPAVLDLLARVHIGLPPEPGPAAAEFLEAMDAVEVERAALSRADLESVPGGVTAAVLRQLAEWARGA